MADTTIPQNKFIIIVAGPTAIGKTAVSIQLAQYYNAEIFSADSRQIYKEMHVGTAVPSKDELHQVRHHFVQHISVQDKYSVGHYLHDLKNALNDYFTSHDFAVVTGGTGLYLKALTDGLDDFPDIPQAVVAEITDLLEEKGIAYLQDRLRKEDPDYFDQVDLNNSRRLIRALSVIQVSGKPYSHFLSSDKISGLPYHIIPILLDMPRETLYQRINLRVDEMMAMGLMSEVHHLLPFKGWPALDTVGYRELFDYIDGKHDLNTAVALIKQNTRRYAKRQMTWFRKYGDWTIFKPDDIFNMRACIDQNLQHYNNML